MNLELASIVISLIALLISGYATYKSFRYKDIEERLNQLEIEKINKEKIDSNKAKLSCEILNKDKGKYSLRIKNKGNSSAKNIRFYTKKAYNIDIITRDIFPYGVLEPGNSIDLILTATLNSESKIIINLTWEDNYKKDNNKDFELALPIV